jgi:hypothetical protein
MQFWKMVFNALPVNYRSSSNILRDDFPKKKKTVMHRLLGGINMEGLYAMYK